MSKQGERRPREADIQRAREAFGANVRAVTSNVRVVAPKFTTLQQARSDALLAKLSQPSYGQGATYSPSWFISYDPSLGYIPESASLAWTKDLTGTVTVAITGNLCDVTDATASSAALLYYYSTASISNAKGTTFEARVRIVSADLATGSGMLMRIEDGVNRFDVYLRARTLNVQDAGLNAASVDLTTFSLVRLEAQSEHIAVYVDGRKKLVGSSNIASSAELVGWGVPLASVASFRVSRVRAAAEVY